jgi:DNA-binding transcriptional ArsR family regulator
MVFHVKTSHDQLIQKFVALADPTRRAMLAWLVEGQANVSEIAEPFLKQMNLSAETKHLKVLKQAGMVTIDVCARNRTSAYGFSAQ